MAHKAGGGIRSKNVTRKPMRQGSPREGVHIGGASQIGAKVGDHTTEHRQSSGYRGESLITGQGFPSRLGNQIAEETKAGPGGSRDIYKSGFQQTHGPTNPGQPMKPSKPLWEGWEK